MTRNFDILIAGGGIIGLSAALQIARRSQARILVVDKGVGPGEGSTGSSSAVCRHKYSHAQMVQLAKDGIAAYRHWPDFLESKAPLARFNRSGVLWMADGRTDWPDRESCRMGALGVRTAVLDDKHVAEAFPALNPCTVKPDLVMGEPHDCNGGAPHLLELDGGYIDPVDALQDLIQAARARGVEIRFQASIAEVDQRNGSIAGARLATGETIGCGVLINAAGPWCKHVFDMVGLEPGWPLEPTRIQIAHVERSKEVEGELPVCIDTVGGIYFRLQNRGQQIIVGSVLPEDEEEAVRDPDDFARFADDDFLLPKLHALQHRLPGLVLRGRIHGYSGLYTVNRADMHPVVGQTPVGGFYVANGCSGHGFKLAPAIGALLARQITGDSPTFDTKVEADFLAFDRAPLALVTRSALA
jgi:glycine/D-amino acid oxidase-like deaminating enzyme